MINIDYIMDLLDWNNSIEKQAEGIKLARNVKSINVFLQPCDKCHNKNVWDNCAKVLCEKADDELSPYLVELLEWLQDLNWPGAFRILDRLKSFQGGSAYNIAFNTCLRLAQALKDDVWESNLCMIGGEL